MYVVLGFGLLFSSSDSSDSLSMAAEASWVSPDVTQEQDALEEVFSRSVFDEPMLNRSI